MSTFDNQSRTPLGERIADVERGVLVDACSSPSRVPYGSDRGWQRKKKKEKICFVLGIFPKEHEGYLIGVKMNTVSKQKLKHKVNIKIYVDK